jgi:RHS repeat-associated protein
LACSSSRHRSTARAHVQQLHGDAWQHTLHDGLGSVRSVVDSSIAVLNPVSYSAYGTPDATVGSPFAFTGEMRNSSGLQYHRARYYSPSLGVWISEDPLETPNRTIIARPLFDPRTVLAGQEQMLANAILTLYKHQEVNDTAS